MSKHADIKELLEAEVAAIRNIPIDGQLEKAVEVIYRQVHQQGGKVVTSGMGKAAKIADTIAVTFSSIGTPAVFIHPGEAQHGDIGLIQERDLLFLVSNSGKTREIIELEKLARAMYPQLPVILLTGNNEGVLCGKAEVLLLTGNPAEICPLNLTPTTSTTVMAVIGDILAVLLMKKSGFSAGDYAARHHGGYLGERSRNASDQIQKSSEP